MKKKIRKCRCSLASWPLPGPPVVFKDFGLVRDKESGKTLRIIDRSLDAKTGLESFMLEAYDEESQDWVIVDRDATQIEPLPEDRISYCARRDTERTCAPDR